MHRQLSQWSTYSVNTKTWVQALELTWKSQMWWYVLAVLMLERWEQADLWPSNLPYLVNSRSGRNPASNKSRQGLERWLSSYYFSRAPGSYSQYPHRGSQSSVTSVLWVLIPFSVLLRHQVHTYYTDTHVGKTSIHIKWKKIKVARHVSTDL